MALYGFFMLTFKRRINSKKTLNPKIMVGGVIGALMIIILVVAYSGTSIIDDTSEGGFLASPSESTPAILPLIIDLENIEILDIDEKVAHIEISFKVTNPNYKSVLLEMIRYNVFEDGTKIGTKSIGDRGAPGGLVSASNYFTILNDRPSIIKDEFTIMNDGNIPEIWSALESNSPNWRITGDAFYNLSSMTSGGENEIKFDFVR
jgi:hypothetical protein|tara:strand:- start:127 stop:741 length:615 start_codon:yes stop_codon:yes gene_type:complete